jgi:hypothetical protein
VMALTLITVGAEIIRSRHPGPMSTRSIS